MGLEKSEATMQLAYVIVYVCVYTLLIQNI